MGKQERGDLGYDFQILENGDLRIVLDGRSVMTLRGGRANSFIKRLNSASYSEQQKIMARMAGGHKRGNERSEYKKIERDF
ncbi:MAG: hypothetical protein K9N35_07800 [Candidatus Marinimicrobia bacterium]|nr:hypothetical protein [Candidatus Neomarinimicrobiota bacterium]